MSYLFASRSDGKPGCCRCGTEIDLIYHGGRELLGPPIIATKEGWLAVCVECYQAVQQEEDL